MKKLFILLSTCLILVTSCKTNYYSRELVASIDYTPLTEKGIYVTESNSVSFNYEAVGSIYIELRSGVELKNSTVRSARDNREEIYSTKSKNGGYILITIDDVYDMLLKQLYKLNANGIVNLKITNVSPSIMLEMGDAKSYYGPGYVVTGMAIRK